MVAVGRECGYGKDGCYGSGRASPAGVQYVRIGRNRVAEWD
jgi:hypothetical protein